MDIIDSIELLENEEDIINLLGFRLFRIGYSLYLIGIDSKNVEECSLGVTDSYYGQKWMGSFNKNNITIYLNDNTKTFIIDSYSSKITVKKTIINEKTHIVLDVKKSDKKNISHISITEDTIEFSLDMVDKKIALYFNSNNDNNVKLNYIEQNKDDIFNLLLEKLSKKKMKLFVSDFSHLDVYSVENQRKLNVYEKEFFNHQYIKEIVELIIKEMSRYFPDLPNYLSKFNVYTNINNISKKHVKILKKQGELESLITSRTLNQKNKVS